MNDPWRTTLITGACGFCGKHLARYLAERGSVRLLGTDLPATAPTSVPLDAYLPADLRDAQAVDRLVQEVRPDAVFHLAGIPGGTAGQVYGVNLLGGIHLLEAVREHAPDARVLVVGSAAEYGTAEPHQMPLTEEYPCKPTGTYGLSKYALTLAAQDMARKSGLRVAIARPFNIVGAGVPRSLVIGAVLSRIREALAGDACTITVGNLDTQRDFVAVEDVVRGYVDLMRCNHWGEIFNLSSGCPVTIRSVVERLLSFAPRPLALKVEPALVRACDMPVSYGSWTKACHAFGFEPKTGIDDALWTAWQHSESRTV